MIRMKYFPLIALSSSVALASFGFSSISQRNVVAYADDNANGYEDNEQDPSHEQIENKDKDSLPSAAQSVEISVNNFPDLAFRKKVSQFDKDNNGTLSQTEIQSIKEISMYIDESGESNDIQCYNLKGIEYLTSLEILDCNTTGIEKVDLSYNTKLRRVSFVNNGALEGLDVRNNVNLESIDVSWCRSAFEFITFGKMSNLKSLSVANTGISSLDLSNCPSLESLTCFGTNLTILDVSNKSKLENIVCGSSLLEELNINNCVKLNKVSFYSTDNLKKLQAHNCKLLTESSIEGIGFDNLSYIDLGGTAITNYSVIGGYVDYLNLSECTQLTKVRVNKLGLRELDVHDCVALEELSCSDNSLETLNVSGCTSLKTLECGNYEEYSKNRLKKIDLTDCVNLTTFSADQNALVSLDLSRNSQLKNLFVSFNQIAELDVSNCPNMSYLSCEANFLKELDVSKNVNLEYLICSLNTDMTSLDVSNCHKLRSLNFDYCPLTYLNASGTLLNSFEKTDGGFLKELYFNNCSLLTSVKIQNSGLERLEIRGCDQIEIIDCSCNRLQYLDASFNPKLSELYAYLNNLSYVDTKGDAELNTILIGYNNLESLDLSTNVKLLNLDCISNKIQSLNISGCYDLLHLHTYNNKLSSINIYGMPIIQNLFLNCGKEDRDTYYYIVDDELNAFSYDKNTKVYYKSAPTPTKVPTQVPTKTPTKAPTKVPTKSPTKPTKAPTKTPTKKPTPVPVPSKGTIADFVERLYTVALGRPSEKDGKAYWVKEITNGNKTGADCGLFFLTSEEFNNRGLSIENFVETLYKTFFDRKSEPNGKAYWVGELKSGRKSRADVIWGFIDSKEWCNICAGYGVKSGAPTAKADIASQNAIDFATRLYTCCLGRAPEKGGLNYWSLALTNLEKTGSEAAQLFFESQEFVNLGLDNKEYITRLYTTFMDRQPEDGGMQYWLGEMTKGKTRRDVMASFAQSPEFTDICKKYGIDRGEVNMKAPQPPKPSADLKSECEKLVSRIKKTGKDYGWSTTTKVIRNTDSQYGIVITCTLNANRNIVLSVAAKAELKSDGTVDSFYASQSLDGGDGYDSYTERVSYDSLKSVLEYYSSNPG